MKYFNVIFLGLIGWIGIAGAGALVATPRQYVVALKPGIGIQSVGTDEIAGTWGASVQFKHRGIGVQSGSITYRVLQVDTENVEAVLASLQNRSDVVSVEPNLPVSLHNVTELNDPLIGYQSYLAKSNIMPAMTITPTRSVVVAVLDTGVDRYHPDLQRNIWVNSSEPINGIDDDNNGYIDDRFGYNFTQYSVGGGGDDSIDVHGHGTHIAGIIAAEANNRMFGSGINPSARIMAVRFLDANGRGTQFDAAVAIRYAVDNGAEILNCSWGYLGTSQVLADAIQYAADNGVVVIASAGNSGTSISEYPASYDSVISVGSVSLDGLRSSFSNTNASVDVMSYGEEILSLLPNGGYGRMTGTSQATAVVTGVVSRLMAALPKHTMGVDTLIRGGIQIQSGPPILDVEPLIQTMGISTGSLVAAMTTDFGEMGVRVSTQPGLEGLGTILNFPNPVRNDATQFGFDSGDAGRIRIRIFDLSGQLIDTLESFGSIGRNVVTWQLNGASTTVTNGTYLVVVEQFGAKGRHMGRGKLTVLR